jgi:hypothetical protein
MILLTGIGCNPFAPELDMSIEEQNSLLSDRTTVAGIFQNMAYAYTFRDTSVYGQLLTPQFSFVYRDYERGADVSWGYDEELRATYGMFQNVMRLDLVWNNITSTDSTASIDTIRVTRNFNLTVTFNPADIISVTGYARFTLARPENDRRWCIVQWRDESNF